MILQFMDFIAPFESHSYITIFVILLACGFGLPVPEDVTLIIGGILSAYKVTNFGYTVVVCLLGVLCGDCIIFLLGKFLGKKILKSKILSKMIRARYIALIRLKSAKYGNYLMFFARFTPGVRTPAFFAMGMFRSSFWKFVLIDGFAALISVPLWVYVGMLFGDNIPKLEHHLKKMEVGFYVIIVLLILFIVVFHYLKKRVMSTFLEKE
jgi:membrane protein DedA with SNARE-associated domain